MGKESHGKDRPGTQASDNSLAATISLAMIVKDEEKNLPRALKSARPWVDEIIVVDTGSTDRTVQIAEEFGAKIYHHPWEFDFAKHRNQSISYATGDWVLILDADEELDQETAPLLAGLTANPNVCAYEFKVENVFSTGQSSTFYSPRFCRNLPGLGYRRRVHNQINIPGAVGRCSVLLRHFGYGGDSVDMERKKKRLSQMLERWVGEEPENWEAHYHLARHLSADKDSLGRAARAAGTALELAAACPQAARCQGMAYGPLLYALAELGRWDEVFAHADHWLTLTPENPDPAFFLARGHFLRREWKKAARHAGQFRGLLEKLRQEPKTCAHLGEVYTISAAPLALAMEFTAQAVQGNVPQADGLWQEILAHDQAEEAVRLAVSEADRSGLTAMAVKLAQMAARERPQWEWPANYLGEKNQGADSPDPARCEPGAQEEAAAQAMALAKSGKWRQAGEAFERALALGPETPRLLYDLGFVYAAQERLNEAEACLQKAVEMDGCLAGAHFNLGVVLFKKGRIEEAKSCLTRCLAQEPSHGPAGQLLRGLEGLNSAAPQAAG